ncbi:MAG: PilN domain-containing protein [Rhodobacteraceae bacterium]|nr:PilN domain-containing protein [Paracoccaceae bacterium]
MTRSFADFRAWLGAELTGLLPGWVGAMFLGINRATPLRFRPGLAQAIIERGAVIAPEALVWGPVAGSTVTLPSLAGRTVDAELPPSFFLRRDLDLPAAALRALSQAAELDLTRRTPFRPAEVHAALGPAQRGNGRVAVAQWVARRADVESLARRLADLGLRLRRVVVAGEYIVVADRTTYLGRGARLWRRANGVLALASVALAAALWLGPAWQARGALHSGAAGLGDLRAEAVALRQEVEALRTRETERSAFVDAVIRRPRAVEALRELTVAIPDAAWVGELAFSADRVVIAGEVAGSAADLALALAESRGFQDPRLTGPVSRTADGSERFELSVSLGPAP